MTDVSLLGFAAPDVPPASAYDACIRCGMCLPTCPTYVETMTETSGPRGRISLIKAVAEGQLDLRSPGFTHQMSECLDCRACAAVCPSGVNYGVLLENARAQIERDKAPQRSTTQRAMRAFLLRRLFADLNLMRRVASLVRVAQRWGLIAFAERSGLLHSLHMEDAATLQPRIDDHFFIPNDQRYEVPNPVAEAFLHAGCIMHVAFASVHEATVRMLQRGRCTVVVPREQGCCGAIAVHAGDPDFARTLAKKNIVAFERSGADVYVVNAAGCGAALKEYGELFHDDPQWRERAEKFSSRVRDVTEVLDGLELDPNIGPMEMTVTYQDPCHLAHAQRVTGAPRRLLAKIPALRFVEMNESSLCCGSAGIYNLTQPEMARRLGKRKITNALATNANAIVTANPGCALQLRSHLRQERRNDVQVMHVVELLDRAYAASENGARPDRNAMAAHS